MSVGPGTLPPVPREALSVPAALWRWGEMLAIFFGVPLLVALFLDPEQRLRPWFEANGGGDIFHAARTAAGMVIPVLLAFTLLVVVFLVRDPTFPKRRLWNARGAKREIGRVLVQFAIAAPALLAVAWALSAFTDVMTTVNPDGSERNAFLYLPRNMPWVLVFIGIGYPVFSAYPQEITHRAFFFHRYRALFPNDAALIVVNALAFAWLHIPFWSVEALLLTLPGGLLFAWTYRRSGSTLAAGIEHALYGWWAFFTGLGWFVFTGSIGA
jgi:membrane protease YdiL (CAAX protease family)